MQTAWVGMKGQTMGGYGTEDGSRCQARGNCNGPKVWVGLARMLKGEDATKTYTREKGGRRIN